jgi:ABC-type Mn2+/Zn2+ transport system permease subunit
MDWMIDPFAQSFAQRALLGGVLAVIATSLVGTWVIIRGMAFMGDALVHGVVPGIAVAVVVGFDAALGAALAAVVMVAGINLVHRQTAFSEDTSIGLLFVGMLALGVIIISRSATYSGDLTTILFGDALGVTTGDLTLLAIVAALAIAVSIVFYRPFLALSFNESKAQLLGMRPQLAHFVLLGLIAIAVIGSFRTVGTLLVFGLLIAPPATAALISRRVPTMMITSASIGVVSVAVGLVISYHLDTSGSATMALVPVVLFFGVLTAKSLRREPA